MKNRKNTVIASALAVVLLLITFGAIAFAKTKNGTITQTASTPSSIIWPVDVAGHDWYIFQGYNHGDHGGIPSQKFGFDLEFRDGSSPVGQPVRSPVTGTLAGFDHASDSNSGDCLLIDFIDAGGNARTVSLCHLTIDSKWFVDGKYGAIASGMSVTQGKFLGSIHEDTTGGNHLHFNIRDKRNNPIQFFAPDSISGCGKSDWPWDRKTSNQWAGTNISCFGYWTGPSPTGTDTYPIHLYGNPPSRNIKLGFQSSDSKGKVVDYVDFWDYQNGKWNWIGRQKPDNHSQEFTEFTLTGPGYIGVDAHAADGNWHLAQDGLRELCVVANLSCPSSVAYHDGSTQPVGTGGGGNSLLNTTDAQLCSGTSNTGICVALPVGGYNDLTQQGINFPVLSVWMPNGTRTLFTSDQTNQAGTPQVFDSSNADLKASRLNTTIKSARVEIKNDTTCNIAPNANGIAIYRDVNNGIGGGCTLLTGSINDLGTIKFTRISSLKFLGTYIGHYKVTAYTDANYGTVCSVYTVSQFDLQTCAQQDIVSIKIEPYTGPQQAQNLASLALRDHPSSNAAVDDSLDTEWNGGHGVSLGFVFDHPVTIQSVVIFDRKQNNPDNNQINKVKVVFSNGTIVDNIDMTSGGPRCAQISFSPITVTSVNVVPFDSSGSNGYREIQIWDTSGVVASENNCVMKFQVTPVTGTGPTPIVMALPLVAPTATDTPILHPTPIPTAIPTPTPAPTQPLILADFNNGAQGWQLDNGVNWNSGGYLTYSLTSGSTLRATGQFSASTNGYTSLKMRVNSHGNVIFYNSSVFINGALQAPITNYCANGDHYNGWQDVVIPLSVFASPKTIQSITISFYTLDSSATMDVDNISLIP